MAAPGGASYSNCRIARAWCPAIPGTDSMLLRVPSARITAATLPRPQNRTSRPVTCTTASAPPRVWPIRPCARATAAAGSPTGPSNTARTASLAAIAANGP